jgi:hypothetical protein
MNIYSGLLFLHGHIADAELARQLVAPEHKAALAEPRAVGKQVHPHHDAGEVPVAICPAAICHAGRGTTSGFRG